jgi:hypothetical protein
MWRGAVTKAIKGKRGQAFLLKLKESLEALPQKRLAKNLVCKDGEVCAIGSLVARQGGDISRFEKYIDHGVVDEKLSDHFDVAPALVKEVMFENDQDFGWTNDNPEQRYIRMLNWVNENIVKASQQQSTEVTK